MVLLCKWACTYEYSVPLVMFPHTSTVLVSSPDVSLIITGHDDAVKKEYIRKLSLVRLSYPHNHPQPSDQQQWSQSHVLNAARPSTSAICGSIFSKIATKSTVFS